MGRRLKQRFPLLMIFLILVAGMGVMGYPLVSDWLSMYTASVEIADYKAVVEKEDTSELDRMMEEAVKYNEKLSRSGYSEEESAAEYDSLLAVTDVIGYLEIPKLSVYLPVYHTISDEVLQKGIGHMPETSLPVGGESTHSVLSGHTGLPAAKLFTDIDQLEEGDQFYVHVLNQILAYEVDQIKTVLPHETDDIQIVDGEDYVTLLTCTPYGVNSHRLLVRGARTQYVPQQEEVKVQKPITAAVAEEKIPAETILQYGAAIAGGFVLFVVLLILLWPSKKSKRRKD